MQRRLLLLPAICLLALAGKASAQTTVTLREATDVRMTANADGTRLSFDLAGLIWTVNAADGEATPLTRPELLARRPALSPDGRTIIFEAGVPGRRHLWRISAAGGEPEVLTFGDYDHHNAAWHPDGERVAFVSNRNGRAGIWELELADLNLRQRSFGVGDEREPAYSPTGDRLVYVRTEGDSDALYVVGEDGRSTRLFANPGRIHAPSWRPDESLLSFVHRGPGVSELRIAILSDPPVVRRLTRGENLLLSPAQWLDVGSFIYMADGRIKRRNFDDFTGVDINFQARLEIPTSEVALAPPRLPASEASTARGVTGMARVGERIFVTALGDLWELDTAGTVVSKLTTSPFQDTQLAGAPDGSALAFVSDRGGSLQLWRLDLETLEFSELTDEPAGAYYPAWHPDGTTIAYLGSPHPDARTLTLKQVELAEGKITTLARGLPESARPQWLPDGRLSVTLDDARTLNFNAGGSASAGTANGPASRFFSPNGTHLALLYRGRLEVARADDPDTRESLADAGASAPQWLDGGTTLAWLGADGAMTWSAAGGEIAELPIGLSWQPAAPPSDRRLVIRAGRVFDGIGPGYEYAQDILIVGNRIESVGPWRDPPQGELLDARDLTVLPGLLDLAVQPRRPDGQRAGRAWLAYGVTSVREFVQDPVTALERRESWASGQRPGPRLFAVLSGCQPDTADFAAAQLEAVGVAICSRSDGPGRADAIDKASQRGLSAIAADSFPGALLGARELPLRGRPGEVAGYPDAANRFIYGDLIEVAGAAGLVSVTNLSAIGLPALLLGDEALAGDKRLQSLLTPAQLDWYRQSWQAQSRVFSTSLRAEARTAGQSLFRAVGRGAQIVAGSSAPAVPNGLGLHAELQLLRLTGLQPFQILRIATHDAAAAIGAEGTLGGISEGRLADLVLVRGDPLKFIEDTAEVEITLVNGRVFRAADLLSSPAVGNFYSP